MTMYFDDVSRHSVVPWTLASLSPNSNINFNANGQPTDADTEDKEALVVQRILSGYNAEAASQLSDTEGACVDIVLLHC